MTFKLPFHGGLELLIWELKDQANIYVSKTEAERDACDGERLRAGDKRC